jgi:hypothetical protein
MRLSGRFQFVLYGFKAEIGEIKFFFCCIFVIKFVIKFSNGGPIFFLNEKKSDITMATKSNFDLKLKIISFSSKKKCFSHQ